MVRRWVGIVLLGLAAGGCGEVGDAADSGTTADPSSSDTGVGTGDESGGDPSGAPGACVFTPTVLGGVDEVGITGVAASEVLAQAQGTFVGGIVWHGGTMLEYAGPAESSALTLTITHDGGEIRSMDGEIVDCTETCNCEDRLEVDVTWRLQSADGVLDETWTAPLLHEPRSFAMRKPIGVARDFAPDDTTGTLSSASFVTEGVLESLRAQVTFRNGAAEGSIDSRLIWNDGALFGPVAAFAGLRDGVGEVACHEIEDGLACGQAGCTAVVGYQQVLGCECAEFEDEFCFATAPPSDGVMTWYTHESGDTWETLDQVVALPSFGDSVPAPWTACTEAEGVQGCACASEAPACG